MQKIAQELAICCVQKGIIEAEDTEWFIYGIEKRLTTLVTSLFFLSLATFLTDFYIAISFLGSFLFLRTRINGYHAKNYYSCFLASILSEAVFLRIILPFITIKVAWVLNVLSILLISLFAPINSPNIHMTQQELTQSKKYAYIRLLILIVLLFTCRRNVSLLLGLTLGNLMAALFVVIEIIKGGITSVQRKS